MTIINQLTSFKLSGITFSGTSQQLNYTSGVTTGSVIANKAVVVDTNRDLIGTDTTTRIRNLTLAGALSAVTIYGTILTANQPNITSLGTITNLTISNNLNLTNHNSIDTGLKLNGNIVLTSAHQLNYNTVTPGTAEANKTLVLDSSRMISNIHAITMTHLYTSNIYINNELVTTSASEINYLDIISIGQGQASKALILDSSRNISNINILTANTIISTNVNITNLSGTITTAAQPNITSLGTLTSLTLSGSISGVNTLSTNNITLNGTSITASGTELNILTGVTATSSQINLLSGLTAGTVLANKAVSADSSRTISNINSINLNGINDVITISNSTNSARTNLRFINDSRSWELGSKGSTATPSNCFYLYDNNAANNRLIVYPNGNIDIVAHNSSVGLMLGGSLVTASATEINILKNMTASTNQLNYLSSTTPGTANANKAIILDSALDIIGIDNIGTTSITLGTQTTNISQRFISAMDSNQLTNSSKYLSFGRSNTDRNCVDLGFLYNNTSSNANAFTIGFSTIGTKFILLASGFTGINTNNPSKQFEINSSSGNCLRLTYNNNTGTATNYVDLVATSSGQYSINPSSNNANSSAGDILLKGSVIIGKDSTNNLIRFNGITGDSDTNVTVIGERLYDISNKSELLFFKGKDPLNSNGPDRIRHRAALHLFQTFTSIEDYSTLSDNNTRLIIMNDGKIGFNSTNPSKQLEINSSSGDCLRLTYNNSGGTATIYSDLYISSSGTLRLISTNNTVVIGNTTSANQTLLIGADSNTSTTGAISLSNLNGVNYIYSGINTTTGSNADLIISNYNQDINTSTRKILFKSDGSVGFGTTQPSKSLEINSISGDCLRLAYNAPTGSATTYCDIKVSSTGNTIFTTTGSNTSFTFTGGNILGSIGTASQPNITSLGTLTSLTMNGAISGITNLTLSGTISGASSISATSFVGLMSTVNQTNITGLGILDNLKISNNLKIGTTGANAEDMIHLENSTNNFIGIQIENRNNTAETSGCKISFMGFRDVNNAYEVTRIASVTTTSDAPTIYQYGALAFYTRNNYLDSSLTECMRIINSGNVGIGTTNPTEKLHVNGNIYTSGNITSNGTLNVTNSINGKDINAINGGRIFISNNDLGLSHRSNTGSTKSELVTYSNGTITGIGSFNSFPFSMFINNTEYVRIGTNGNFGIRTTNPQGLLDFGQNASDSIINLFTNTSTTETYKIGANNTALKYQSGTGGLHIWYNNSTTASSGTERMRLDTSGNLGINTTTPSYKLDISGTARTSQILLGNSTDNGSSRLLSALDSTITTGSTTRTITLGKANSQNNQAEITFNWVADGSSLNYLTLGMHTSPNIISITGSSNVGIGTNTPVYKLEVVGTTRVHRLLVGDSTDSSRMISMLDSLLSSGSSKFLTLGKANSQYNQAEISYYHTADNSDNNKLSLGFYGAVIMTLLANGNVGIGTTSPTYKLDISGSGRFNGSSAEIVTVSSSNVDALLAINNSGTNGRKWWLGTASNGSAQSTGSFFIFDTAVSATRLNISSGGNFGIDTSTPACKMDIANGTLRVLASNVNSPSSGKGVEISYDNNADRTNIYSYDRSNSIYKQLNLNDRLKINGGGDCYVYNSAGTNTFRIGTSGDLEITGTAYKPGGGSWASTSDIRIKENITNADINLCYNNIKSLKLKYYKWKDEFIDTYNIKDKHKIGWIAQEVEQYIPKAVQIIENSKFNIKDFKSLDVDQIYASMYGAIQKIIIDKENLEDENKKLNERLSKLENMILELHNKF